MLYPRDKFFTKLVLIFIFVIKPLSSESFEIKNLKQFHLSNKLRVILIPEKNTNLVKLRWVVFNGESSSFAGLEGLATLTARTFFKGSAIFPQEQLTRLLSYYGIRISSDVREEKSSFTISLPKENFERFLVILNDLLLRNTFPEDSLNEERNLIIRELRRKNEEPAFFTYSFLYKNLFLRTPYIKVLFTEDSLRKVTPQNCLSFLKRYYVPNNSVLFVWGDFEMEELKKSLEKGFSGWSERRLFYPYIPTPSPTKEYIIFLLDYPIQDSYFAMGNILPVAGLEERAGLLLFNEIIGGSEFSRLNLKFKETLGYCNYIESNVFFFKNSTIFFVMGQCRSNRIREILTGVTAEIKDLKEKKIEDNELKSAKDYLIGDLLVKISDPEVLLSFLEDAILNGYSIDYMDRVLREIEGFSKEELLSIANKYFKIDSNFIVLAGRKEGMVDYLKDLGKIEIYFKINNLWERER